MYNVLIVDEEEHLLWALEQNLFPERDDIRIVTASDGETGLEMLKEHPIDLLVSDIKMPGKIDGFQLILRAKEAAPDARVVIMTAFGTNRIQNFADRIGITHYIEKPFDTAELRDAILEILDEKEGFQGVLSDLELTDIIQMLCLAKRTAMLHLKHRDHRGKIVFDKGDVVHAEFDGITGDEAVFEMLALRQGDIFMQSDFHNDESSVSSSWQDLLFEGIKRADEQRHRALIGDEFDELEDDPAVAREALQAAESADQPDEVYALDFGEDSGAELVDDASDEGPAPEGADDVEERDEPEDEPEGEPEGDESFDKDEEKDEEAFDASAEAALSEEASDVDADADDARPKTNPGIGATREEISELFGDVPVPEEAAAFVEGSEPFFSDEELLEIEKAGEAAVASRPLSSSAPAAKPQALAPTVMAEIADAVTDSGEFRAPFREPEGEVQADTGSGDWSREHQATRGYSALQSFDGASVAEAPRGKKSNGRVARAGLASGPGAGEHDEGRERVRLISGGFEELLEDFARECAGLRVTGIISAEEGLALHFVGADPVFDPDAIAAFFGDVVQCALRTVEALGEEDRFEELQIALAGTYLLIRRLDGLPYLHVAVVDASASLGVALVLMRRFQKNIRQALEE